MSVSVLLLEDDRLFNETLEDFLSEEGFEVDTALDPYSALDLTYENRYDIYLFDINLPYESGFDLLEKLRQSGDTTPTIFLTSREDKASMMQGFGIGADDYMTKPLDPEELVLRIHAILRRQLRNDYLTLGDYKLDVRAKRLYDSRGDEVDVTKKALELLVLLLEAKGAVVSVETIKERLWAAENTPGDGVIRVYITQLKKIFPHALVNIRGVGYKWVDA